MTLRVFVFALVYSKGRRALYSSSHCADPSNVLMLAVPSRDQTQRPRLSPSAPRDDGPGAPLINRFSYLHLQPFTHTGRPALTNNIP